METLFILIFVVSFSGGLLIGIILGHTASENWWKAYNKYQEERQRNEALTLQIKNNLPKN